MISNIIGKFDRKNPDKKIVVSSIVTVGFVVSLFYHYVMGSLLHKGYPYNTFLFNPNDRFMDFFNNVKMSEHLLPYQSGLWAVHFPLSFIISYPFSLISNPSLSFCVFVTIFVIYYMKYMSKFIFDNNQYTLLNIYCFISITMMSYPILFAIDRGNFELYVFIFMSMFQMLYVKERNWLSAFFLGLAIAMKLFPAVFLVLYLERNRRVAGILSVVVALLANGISLLAFKASVFDSLGGMKYWQGLYVKEYVINNAGLAFGNSLWGIVKLSILNVYTRFGSYLPEINVNALLKGYLCASIIIFVIVSIVIIKYNLLIWQKILLLTICINLCPYVSADYKLIHLYIPIALFVIEEKRTTNDLLYSILFGVMLIPKAYYWFMYDVNVGVVINPLLMLIMGTIVIKSSLNFYGANSSQLAAR